MFVTSDIYDIPKFAQFHKVKWRECLVEGVGLEGAMWPGFHAAARFLVESSVMLGNLDAIENGGYCVPGDWRTKALSRGTMIKSAITRDEKREGQACAALFRGRLNMDCAPYSFISVGGEISGRGRLDGSFGGVITYPLRTQERSIIALSLLKMSADILNADYAFYYVRDNWLGPSGYNTGLASGNLVPLPGQSDGDAREISNWQNSLYPDYWSDPSPRLRDVYEFNLICERHLTRLVGDITLGEWISSSAAHGTLENIDNGKYLWSLTTAQMKYVRPQLILADAIFARHERVWR